MTTQLIPLDYATPLPRPASLTSTIAWTVVGVGAIFLAGKGITALGHAMGMPYGCWQLTGLRAAASATVVGTLVATGRGQLALLGLLYALTLVGSHSTAMPYVGAVLAGIGAWLVSRMVVGRTTAILATTLTFNVLLTLSGLVYALQHTDHLRLGLAPYGTGLGMRIIATLLVVGVILFVVRRK
jgi:hypothetical protein